MKLPYMKFYTRDWRADQCVRAASPGARALWLECLCLAHEAEPYGHVLVNDRAPTLQQLAIQVSMTVADAKRYRAELLECGVASESDDGVLFSRRMVRDAVKRSVNQENGRNGGNPRLTGSDKTHMASGLWVGFCSWYKVYPNKKARGAAERAWGKLAPDADLVATMAAAVEIQAQSREWTRDNGAYIPHPATWLNGRRWEDEPVEASQSTTTMSMAGIAAAGESR